jgi:hypothetical protein
VIVIPVLMWLWVNVHGSFALASGTWVPPHRSLGRRRPAVARRERAIATGAVVGFLVSFINPYGASLVLFPIELLSRRGPLA